MSRLPQSLRVITGAALAVVTAAVALPAAAQASAPPFSDPSSAGAITLCDRAGQAITSGSVSTTPLAWTAVDSQPAPSSYQVAGATATLYAYQPRQDVPSGEWSGEQLTAAGRYTGTAHPTAAATAADASLQDFLSDYPATWKGLVELRLYLGAPGMQVDSVSYPTVILKVDGSHWTVIDPGPDDCVQGKAVSVETLLLPKSQLTAPPSPGARPSTAATDPASGQAAQTESAVASSRSSNRVLLVVIGVIAVVAAMAGAYGYGRRRGRPRGEA